MKKNNKKLITLLLAGMLCSTVAGVANIGGVTASAATGEYSLSEVFSTSDGVTIGSKTLSDNATGTETLTFTFDSDSTAVRYTNDLAFAWYEAKNEAKYLTVDFAFADTNFTEYVFAVESESAWATEDEKVTNSVYFVYQSGAISVAVLNDGEEFVSAAKATAEKPATPTVTLTNPIVAGSSVTLALEAGDEDGEFDVKVNDEEVGSFENVGSNWAEYTYNEAYASRMFPLQIIGKLATGQTSTALYLKKLNGQSFNNIANGKIKDDAVPVIAVDDKLYGFELGDSFSLDYTQIDVLQKSLSTETKKYYQFNPTDAAPPSFNDAKVISGTGSSLYFMDTVYTKADGTKTSVYKEYGEEYVSVQISVGDSAHTGDDRKIYDLSWYADASAIRALTQTNSGTGATTTTDFIKIYVSEEGAEFKILTADFVGKKNDKSANYTAATEAYQTLLDKAAEGKYLDEEVNFPSFAWLFDDDNGYRNLKFTISYKTPSSDSAKSMTGIAYNKLKLTATEEGLYEFKIFAYDLAGNPMKYYNADGELVDVTVNNVWDIEEIPSFTFEIANKGVKVKEVSSSSARRVSKTLDDTYTLSDLTVLGAKNRTSEFKLYKLEDISDYSKYTSVTFADLKEEADKLITAAVEANASVDYFDLYLQAYATKTGVAKAKFVEIGANNSWSEQSEKDAWEKFQFDASAGSFVVAEEGGYLILANYWNTELPTQRAGAYKIISVASEADSVKGDSDWVKDNLVSIILFSVAGVMLIVIIILLLVKPSKETLEDVDKKAKAKKEKKEKKAKETKVEEVKTEGPETKEE